MSCNGYADSFLFITCKDEEQLKAALKVLEDSTMFDTYTNEAFPLKISLELHNSEIYRSFDHDLEEFARTLKEQFDLNVSGYLIEEIDGDKYRCEFNADGELRWITTSGFGDYSIDQIAEIQKYAERRFGNKWNCVELFCPHCQKTQLVTANMIRLESGQLNVVTDTEGHCELDWDTGDISGDFEYVCEECGERIAADLCEVEERLKQEKQ